MVGGTLCPASLKAQDQNFRADFSYIKNSDAWLNSENAAGLNNLKIEKISMAEIYFNKSDGKFINYFQSDNSYTLGGLTESFYRLNNKVTVYGRLRYSDFSGKNMGGSTLIDPYYNSFDIVEYADSTAGEKKMETYHLKGGLSSIVLKDLILGLCADYKTISYFKTRDLRHTNDLMDLTFTMGIRYKFKNLVDAGINYFYRKTTENTNYEAIGNMDKQFNSLICYGSFFGRQERFGDYGFTGSGDDNPFFNAFQGITIQFDLFPENDFHFYNETGIKWRKGYFGKRSTTTIMYTENESNILFYKGMISKKNKNSLHQLSIHFDTENLTNFEKSYRKESTIGGNSMIVYYGKNEVLDRGVINAKVTYTGNLNVKDMNPEWVISGGANFSSRDQTTTLYPFFRKQNINQYSVEASAKRNLFKESNIFTFNLNGTYGTGSGTQKEDGQYGSDSQSSAKSLDRYLFREYEYLTVSRATAMAGFRYTRQLPKNNNLCIFGDIQYSFSKAFSTIYIGDTFSNLAISIGCIF